jgi:hypothetical protein
MPARLILRPDPRGTKQLVAQYGDRLVCIPYRYDGQRQKHYTTVELIVSEAAGVPPPPTPDTIVAMRVAGAKRTLGRRLMELRTAGRGTARRSGRGARSW